MGLPINRYYFWLEYKKWHTDELAIITAERVSPLMISATIVLLLIPIFKLYLCLQNQN